MANVIGNFESGSGDNRIYEGTSLSINYTNSFIYCWYVKSLVYRCDADQQAKGRQYYRSAPQGRR